MNRLIWVLAIFMLSLGGCTVGQKEPVPEPLDLNLCEESPSFCEEVCASCEDTQACYEANGECPVAANKVFYIDDATDGGDDMWTAGCHYTYSDNACTMNKAFHKGDLCGDKNKDLLIEWTNAKCHGPQGDTNFYNCDTECKKKGLIGGTCKVVTDACGKGRNSAKCECFKDPT